jgi:uncharacterized protein YdeI (YjbR/CyaY-like superfamily)
VTPRSFRSQAAFRSWLERHHADSRELLVRCFKVHAAQRGLTYRQALDEALCFGWIDGVRRSVDGDSFSVRFTPRRRGSYWSSVNRARAAQLEAEGRMHEAGRAAAPAAGAPPPARYSFEGRPPALSPAFRKRLRADRQAQAFFSAQPPWYRRTSTFWVMSARKEETRERRFAALVECSRAGRTIPPLGRVAPTRRRAADTRRAAGAPGRGAGAGRGASRR